MNFEQRFEKHYDELKWLYCELYHDRMDMFEDLCRQLRTWYDNRNGQLKKLDNTREEDSSWYKKNDILGMMMHTDMFAGNLKGMMDKIDYIEECNVNYIHLMPLLATPKGKSDGGYAVSDFRTVQSELGTMDDLEELAAKCHKKGISVCLDFVMNHTSEEHEWARKARMGDIEYINRYFCYDNYDIPAMYEKTVPQVFPTTAPGNFTWREDMHKFVMTTFYPYQWDLNYGNPVVFNEMTYNLLNLANKGMDIIRIDAVPYIWKEIGTSCRNLKQVHSIVRMLRMITEIVCPGVILLGEVVMEPEKVVPYFGTVEKPECHMLYNVTTMATTWHSVASANIELLKKQMDAVNSLSKEYVFLNYLRCHDDIGWGLDYDTLKKDYIDERAHKKYLSEYFTGNYPGSIARGELYNADPTSGDARQCGTTASLCGIEAAEYERRTDWMLDNSVNCDLMLHAYMLTQSGIPVIYSGDEVAQLNDYSYKDDPDKREDSRYLHRGKFNWELAKNRHDKNTVEGTIFEGIHNLSSIRKEYDIFSTDAAVNTIDVHEEAVLCIKRELNGKKLIALFNFSNWEKIAWINEEGVFTNIINGEQMYAQDIEMKPYQFLWLLSD